VIKTNLVPAGGSDADTAVFEATLAAVRLPGALEFFRSAKIPYFNTIRPPPSVRMVPMCLM
jgi:hypothetical protein